MLDILAAIGSTALAVVVVGTLVLARDESARIRATALATAWFAIVVALGAFGLFAPGGPATLLLGLLVPVGLATFAVAGLAAAEISPVTLVALNAGRLIGVSFLALLAAGRISPTFALSAGWGDILVGLTALPVARMIQRRSPGWRPVALAWNTVGTLDLVLALTFGVGSAPGPLRFIFEAPGTGVVGTLPWLLIPAFLVPLYLIGHFALFGRIARLGAPQASRPARGLGEPRQQASAMTGAA